MDNYQKHIAKAIQELIVAQKLDIIQWPNRSPSLQPNRACFPVLQARKTYHTNQQ